MIATSNIPIRSFVPRWIDAKPPPKPAPPPPPSAAEVAEYRRIATEALNQRDRALAELRAAKGV